MDKPKKPHIAEESMLIQAKEILIGNTRDGRYTVPSSRLYPYQWNWDSGFAAMGFAHFDLKRAMLELKTLFEGQWENGMLPHILFHSRKTEGYFPGPNYWRSDLVNAVPSALPTSGITQPPVHGFILERLVDQNSDSTEVKDFAQEIFPKIVKLHQYYYSYRDPNQEGLAYIFHPWASGRDNSPLWDDLIQTISFDKKDLPSYQRVDNLKADPSERPSDRDYDVYVYLMELAKRLQYDGRLIAEESPFMVQDTLFNAVLIRSNEALIHLGKRFGRDVQQIEEWQEQSKKQFDDKLWVNELGLYAPFDLRNGHHIQMKEIGGYTALYADIPAPRRAEEIRSQIEEIAQPEKDFRLMPSFDPMHEIFDPKRYWKGPIWPQMNWLVYQGLKRYNFDELASKVKWDFLELVDKLGFHEYFDPRKAVADQLEHGYGGDRFSWTAAVVLDLITDK